MAMVFSREAKDVAAFSTSEPSPFCQIAPSIAE
jgi:hypothetical protein